MSVGLLTSTAEADFDNPTLGVTDVTLDRHGGHPSTGGRWATGWLVQSVAVTAQLMPRGEVDHIQVIYEEARTRAGANNSSQTIFMG